MFSIWKYLTLFPILMATSIPYCIFRRSSEILILLLTVPWKFLLHQHLSDHNVFAGFCNDSKFKLRYFVTTISLFLFHYNFEEWEIYCESSILGDRTEVLVLLDTLECLFVSHITNPDFLSIRRIKIILNASVFVWLLLSMSTFHRYHRNIAF